MMNETIKPKCPVHCRFSELVIGVSLVIRHSSFVILRTLVLLTVAATCHAAPLQFDFSGSKPPSGFAQVLPSDNYSTNHGYGFEPGSKVTQTTRGCTSDKPFFFSVALPEGSYRVALTLGSPTNEARTTVKA